MHVQIEERLFADAGVETDPLPNELDSLPKITTILAGRNESEASQA
jgi:hypothetical protein